ncbi:hypothetical protein TEK04_04990 [Klenkia sp. LSe6-5]|uniref:Uncharacterized protein n=1 Tax=Klenkia sesuvii TaxID=3103137 RepID=A0ABU8DQF5_9ACTN
MLIDCDTCTVRGEGCGDCVVSVLLGTPGQRGSAAAVVPLGRRPGRAAQPALPGLGAALGEALVSGPTRRGRRLEFDDVERRALYVLAEMGLVPPLRHQAPPTRDVG